MLSQRKESLQPRVKPRKDILHEHQVLIHHLREYAPYPLLVIDPDTAISYVNSALEELTGYSSGELIGRKPPFPWWTGNIVKQAEDLKSVMLKGERRSEKLARKKNGDQFWIQVSANPIIINGELKYFLSNWVDITERKSSEEQLFRLNQELRNLTAHMDSVREEERASISRTIHDEIGQALTALKMDTCWLGKSLDANQKPLCDLTDSMVGLIDTTFQKIRVLSAVLRPTWLDDLGLPDTMKWLGEEFQEMTGIHCKLTIDRKLDLDKQLSTAIYRIFQEALPNIFRHSRAAEVRVSLKKEKGQICLIVADNGVGISKKQISNPASFGIIGMRERAQFLGGTFEIQGARNKGTSISITIPA